ncbi:MAG: bifunctional pyr operon transcriptional regulator/uracil phosphoribosyltransferase PyrR [Clostridia bacterium]|jgi:Pyrimidine operon attenuation protein/uracil phosphoribosyltransferase|nr:bifunctional pyr operon transcriptional regulator/uracil phosphoribosyltransferase PyrR [Clostridia bacterium]MBO4860423.1 bifunctional pyr operon transcriptional regulator/uracil phosphoribosyltransferase PyrR [Clostridia bacterium]MBO7400052.1 bifunctional pyr operon transcriptional regulator/uracil phosphoribosyltransferase PyrR [Clostridia bacterium]MBO7549002.1 bifunctional pyr operon transcriptional regulator/uracil phosphoribosyltransferase PyrR [Clostridia bacterium]MBO7666020.1 bifu
MEERSRIMNAESVDRALMRISHEILERNPDAKELCIVGVLRRGATLAAQIAENLKKLSDITLYTGTLDITFYRDDLGKQALDPSLNHTDVDFDVEGKTVIIVDDVLYTGRTARAAMDAVIALGRPQKIQLAVLVDRGHRELPIRGDYVGKNVPTSRKEIIAVRVPEYDGQKEVVILG